MPTVFTADRGVIVHLAGRHHLSPGLRDGAPALLPPGEVAGRCGWAPFFRALEARGLAVAFEEDGTARAAPPPSVPARGEAGGHALVEARRFLRALRGEWPPAG